MANQASEVRTEQEARVVRRIPTGAILALAMLGVTERGPHGVTLALDFPEWQASYGEWEANSVINEARAFYDNGGSRLYMSRVVHHTDATDPTTKTSAAATATLDTAVIGQTSGTVLSSNPEPFNLEPADDLDFSIDGGGTLTATFNADAATVTGSQTEPFALTDLWSMTFDTQDGTQTIVFNASEFSAIGAATAAEVAAVINAEAVGIQATVAAGAVVITTDQRGTGSSLGTFADATGTPVATLGFTGASDAGGGNVADIDAVTAAEAQSIIDAVLTGSATTTIESGAIRVTTDTPGASGSVQVEATSTADDEFGFDNATHSGAAAGAVNTLQVDAKTDGDYGNELSITIAAASSGEADEFNLAVVRNSAIVERYFNLSMTDADENYVEKVINDGIPGQGPSNLITVTDLDAALVSPNDLPATGTFGPLTGGDSGLSGLVDTDYVGGVGVNGAVGLRTFDAYTIDVLVVPGRATSVVHNAMITYADITREGLVFCVLDPPAGLTAAEMVTYVRTTAALFGLTENAAIYWPRVKITNPSTTVYGDGATITVPPCGHIAGVMARVDASKIGGAFDQPAGTEAAYLPRGIVDFEDDPNGAAEHEVKQKTRRELVFPNNSNPISQEDGTQIFIDGARNLDITGNWPSIGQRRGTMFVEKRLIPGLAFMRHRNIKPKLYNEGKQTVDLFLLQLTQADALASTVPSEAFSTDFGEGLNPASVQLQRMVKARVGLATSTPAEFIHILIGPDNSALEAELAALAA